MATYYISPTGSDSAAGTSAAPWATWFKANASVAPGDIVNINAGTYPESAHSNIINLTTPGTSTARITYQGVGATAAPAGTPGAGTAPPILGATLNLNGNYITVTGITIESPVASNNPACEFNGSNDVLSNCIFPSFAATASNQSSIITTGTSSSFCTADHCSILNIADTDAFHLWGHDNTISNNLIDNLQQINYNLNHTDAFQTWNAGGGNAYNILIVGNLIRNSTCQGGNGEHDGNANVHDFIFANNIWTNVQNALFWGVPNTHWYNNIWDTCGSGQGFALGIYDGGTSGLGNPKYSAAGFKLQNNIFRNTLTTGSVSGGRDISFQLNASSSQGTTTNNYFSNDTSGSAKTNGEFQGTSAINGGDPKFLSAPTNYHIQTGSVLIGQGVAISDPVWPTPADRDGNPRTVPWDIGPYRYSTGGPPPGTVPSVTASAATNVADTTATLNGNVTTNGGVTITTEGFDWGATTAYGNFAPAALLTQSGTFAANITGLTQNTTYHFRARAINSIGTGTSADAQFGTLPTPPPVNPPSVGVSPASTITTNSALLTGTIISNGNGTITADGFNIGPTTAYGTFIPAALVQSGIFSSPVSNLLPSTTYHFQATATNAAGTSVSSDSSFTTAGPPPPPPTVPSVSTAPGATLIQDTTVTLNGYIASTGGAPITADGFDYGTTTSYGTHVSAATVVSGAFSYALTGLTASTTYHYRATAVNSAGTGLSLDATFTTTAPSPPPPPPAPPPLPPPVPLVPTPAPGVAPTPDLAAAPLTGPYTPVVPESVGNDSLFSDDLTSPTPEVVFESPSFKAMTAAFATALQTFLTHVDPTQLDELRVKAKIAALPEDLLDQLGMLDFRAVGYDMAMPMDQKRSLIMSACFDNAHLGTPASVRKLLNFVFHESTLEEWFQYGGAPYRFRVRTTDPVLDPSRIAIMNRAILATKPVTRWPDPVTRRRTEGTSTCYMGPAFFQIRIRGLGVASAG